MKVVIAVPPELLRQAAIVVDLRHAAYEQLGRLCTLKRKAALRGALLDLSPIVVCTGIGRGRGRGGRYAVNIRPKVRCAPRRKHKWA